MPDPVQVGIGLPVYNNEKFLRQTLDSLLAQTYPHFIVYICDDCSDDNTENICREYSERDKRIRYTKNKSNFGPLGNHRQVLELAETPYFMFARGHEVVPEDLLEKAMGLFTDKERDQEIVLAYAPSRWIDENSEIIKNKYLPQFDTRGCTAVTRGMLALWGKCETFYGIGKTSDFRKVRVLEPVVGTDLIMILEMSLLGTFAELDCGYRLRRYHYSENPSERVKRHTRGLVAKPDFVDRYFPTFKLPFYLLGSIFKSTINFSEKCLLSMLYLISMPVKFLISHGKEL